MIKTTMTMIMALHDVGAEEEEGAAGAAAAGTWHRQRTRGRSKILDGHAMFLNNITISNAIVTIIFNLY